MSLYDFILLHCSLVCALQSCVIKRCSVEVLPTHKYHFEKSELGLTLWDPQNARAECSSISRDKEILEITQKRYFCISKMKQPIVSNMVSF